MSRFPVPGREMQPPNLPLRYPHPLSSIYDVGLHFGRDHSESICRTFSLLPASEPGKYKLADNNYAFALDAEQGENPTWYTMETKIPFTHESPAKLDQDTAEWAGRALIRPSLSSPLFSVSHDVAIALTFSYDLPDSEEKVRERLNFSIPINFGQYLDTTETGVTSGSAEENQSTSIHSSLQAPSLSSRSTSPFLPSYAQLYDSNGDPKVDLSIPLPLYTPREEVTSKAAHESLPTPYEGLVEKPAASFITGTGQNTTIASTA